MWPQNIYGQPQYQQQPYQYNQPPQMPYGNVPPMNNNQFATEAIDWDSVSAIDPDLIRMTGDLTQLQPFISKFVSTNLSTYESQILTHPLSIRLCSILQVSLKYMSNVQKELLAKIEEKDRQISKQQHEFKKLAVAYEKSDELLRKQMRPSERCPLCLKRFKNFDFLDQHIERRHSEHLDEWLSIRNKKPMPKQNQNDINNIMERIDALQKSLRKDRERRGHHHNRRGKGYDDNDENIQTLRQELNDQQDQLMATEAMEEELVMTKRDDMKSELDTAVDDLNASWIAWSNNNKKNKNNNNQKSKAKKPSNGGDEFDNMYNFNDNLGHKFDNYDDQFELNDNFNTKCHSDDDDDDPMKNQNFNENPMNNFQFHMIQNSQVPNQQQPENEIDKNHEETKENKSKKKPKRSLFGRKKSKHNSEQKQNEVFINNQIPYSNLNEFDVPQNIENNTSNNSIKPKKHKQKSRKIQNQVQLPAKKKALPDDVRELITKARQVVVRKFTPTYDESTVNHVMRSIEKKMNAFRQQFANNNETPEQVAESLQSKIDEDQNEYFATKRKVNLRIDNEAPVKHCTLFDSSFTESSAISTANLNESSQIRKNQTKPTQNQNQSQDQIQIQTPDKSRKQQQQQQQQTQQQPQEQEQQKQMQQFQQQMNKIQQQHQQQNISQSSISAKNKRKSHHHSHHQNPDTNTNTNNNNDNRNNVSINIDDIPKPNNSQFTTSYSNYAPTSASTIISPSNTPINGDNKTKPKSSYSYIMSNINETVNQIQDVQDQNQTQNENENENDNEKEKQESKKLQFVQPRPAIQCRKHFKSEGHTVQSPFPMLSPPTTSNEGENIINPSLELNNNNNNQFSQAANGEEVEYVYDEEEEEEEEEVKEEVHQNIITNSVDQNIAVVIEEEEEEHESVPTSSFRRPPPSQSTSQSQSQSQCQHQIQNQNQSTSQPTIQSETVDGETFDESKIINIQNISPPKLNKHAKNEISTSTDLMFDEDSQQPRPIKTDRPNNLTKNEITSSTDTMYEMQRINNINKVNQNDIFDSLDQSEPSASIPLQQAKKMDQTAFKTPPNNNNIVFTINNNEVTNDNITDTTATAHTTEATATTAANTTAQYEYEYYTDDEGLKSDGEIASDQHQKEELNENEKIKNEIENEELEINNQIQQQKENEKNDLQPFLVAPPENENENKNSELNVPDQITTQNSASNLNQDSKQLHSEYYSSSSTNLFYKFDSSTNSKSKSKDFQNTNLKLNLNEVEVEVEVNKTPTDEEPVKQSVYKSSNVGSMDNIVSFDEVKSIESIEKISKPQNISKASVQSEDDSQFNFDSLVEQSNGGDSFISGSSKSFNFGRSNPQQQTQQQQPNMNSNVQQPNMNSNVQQPNMNSNVQQPQNQQQQQLASDSFISKQKNLLASKYGAAPQPTQPTPAPPPQNNNNNNAAVTADVDDDGYEYEEEEEEEEEFENYEFENGNSKQNQQAAKRGGGSGLGLGASGGSAGVSGVKKFNVIDIFKQSSNSSLLKSKKPNNNNNNNNNNKKSFLGSKVQKTFAGSSSAAQDDDEFDYSRGPPMKEDDDIYNDFGDDNFGGGPDINDQNQPNERVSNFNTTSGLSKYVYDSEGPPLLSKKKNDDSLISNDDFNL